MAEHVDLQYLRALTESSDIVRPYQAGTSTVPAHTGTAAPQGSMGATTAAAGAAAAAAAGGSAHVRPLSSRLASLLLARVWTAPLALLLAVAGSAPLLVLAAYFATIAALLFTAARSDWPPRASRDAPIEAPAPGAGTQPEAGTDAETASTARAAASAEAQLRALRSQRSSRARRARAGARRGEVLLFAALAALSLGTTWWHMLRFLAWSLADFRTKAALAQLLEDGGRAVPLPLAHGYAHAADGGSGARALTAACQRAYAWLHEADAWLRATRLFEQAWLYVVADRLRWWWSAEVCAFTVGTWALFLRIRGRRAGLRSAWVYMLIGQLVAISFAQNLFFLALLAAPAGPDGEALGGGAGALGSQQELGPSTDEADLALVRALASTSDSGAGGDGDGAGVVLRDDKPLLVETTEEESSAAAAYVTNAEQPLRSQTVRRVWRQTRVVPAPSVSRALDTLAALPLVVGGMTAVALVPDSLGTILVMHVFPLLLVLPRSFGGRPVQRARAAYRAAIERALGPDRLAALAPRLQPSALYTLLAGVAMVLRVVNTAAVFRMVQDAARVHGATLSAAQPGMRAYLHALWTTFFSHPAQSSISFDHVCIALSSAAWIIAEIRGNRIRAVLRFDSSTPSKFAALFLYDVLTIGYSTIVIGPAGVLAIILALQERALERALMAAEQRLFDRRERSTSAAQTRASSSAVAARSSSAPRKRYIAVDETIEESLVTLSQHETAS